MAAEHLKAAAAGMLLLAAAPASAAVPAAPEPRPASACPAGATRITSEHSLSQAVATAPNGTTFCIEAGLHRLQSAQPKRGQRFFERFREEKIKGCRFHRGLPKRLKSRRMKPVAALGGAPPPA